MDQWNYCRGCGAERPSDAPSGLCPACLLKAGLLGDGSEVHEMTITFGPASSSVLASFGEAFGRIPPVLLRDADSLIDPCQVIRPSSSEIPDPARRSARLQLFGEIARGGMGAVLNGRDSESKEEQGHALREQGHALRPVPAANLRLLSIVLCVDGAPVYDAAGCAPTARCMLAQHCLFRSRPPGARPSTTCVPEASRRTGSAGGACWTPHSACPCDSPCDSQSACPCDLADDQIRLELPRKGHCISGH